MKPCPATLQPSEKSATHLNSPLIYENNQLDDLKGNRENS